MQKLQLGRQTQTALACQCRSFPSRVVRFTATGKADADFVTAEAKGTSRRDVGFWRKADIDTSLGWIAYLRRIMNGQLKSFFSR